ncbi:MAG: PKD domain-containing protein [Mycobacteriaceae bacterium]
MRRHRATAVALVTALILSGARQAWADIDGDLHGDGSATITLSEKQVRDLREPPPSQKKVIKAYEYKSVVDCQSNTVTDPTEFYCTRAVSYCAQFEPGTSGPLIQIWRREIYSNGRPPGPWKMVGRTCHSDLVPSAPVLSMAQIISAFRRTPFAKPTVHIQPEGNTTLVTLPTYFQATWPAQGFQPGEVDTADPAQMLGHTVRIRPLAGSYTYTFGDGTSLGPTSSPGGTYPDGDVTHTYERAGTYPTRIAVTYGGEFSLDGGPWIRIPATAAITGPTQPLQVKTAHNRLYNN